MPIPRMTKKQQCNLMAFLELDDLGSLGFLFGLALLLSPYNSFNIRSIVSREKERTRSLAMHLTPS